MEEATYRQTDAWHGFHAEFQEHIIESFRSALTLNIKWSCDLRYDVNVHRERQ